MRNLKKILALVLAFLMSLSLMAAAGATDFKDDADIAQSNYRQAMEVLSGLGVFNGDQYGNFNPGQPITRAEVAAILYRIGTADTSLEGNKTYAPYNQFTDVQTEDWYAGYVTYCANAGWIKGRSNNDFDPKANVTGYEVLAMILRAVGYDKNSEFVGSNWQLNTASIAREKGVLDNVIGDTSVQLSDPASRAVVAELLLRAMLLNKVSFSTATLSYNDLDERVCDILGLKEVTGVVVANADADLLEENDIGVKSTQTVLWVDAAKGSDISKGDLVTLNIPSDLEAIGEMRTAYMQKTPSRATYEPVVEELYPVDSVSMDNEYKGGAAGAVTTVSKVAGELSLNGIGNYIDYDQAASWYCQSNGIRIRYVIGFTNKADAEKLEKANPTVTLSNGTRVSESSVVQVTADNQAQYPGQKVGSWVFDRVIHIDQRLTDGDYGDYNNLYYIFNNADKYNTPSGEMQSVEHGEVYVGTASVEDKSDSMRWTAFEEEYLKWDYTTGLTIENGNYVKVVDYDNDGYADFALKREYYLDRVTSIYNNTVYYENAETSVGTGRVHDDWFDTDEEVVYAGGVEPKAGDVILRNFIDGVWYGEIVEPVTITVKTVDWKNNKIVDTDDQEWFASGIALNADMDYDILTMDEQVQYNLYLDKGGYIRAYELAQGSSYALLTEMYPTGRNNGAFVTNDNWIAEVMRIDDKYPAEYSLLNSYINGVMNPFIDDARDKTPFNVSNSGVNSIVSSFYVDYLQQAIGHLGYGSKTDADKDVGIIGNGDEFAWGTKTNTSDNESWTNVGKYIMTENGVSLYTASELASKNGSQLYYAWVDLDGDGVVDGGEKFDVLGEKNTGNLRKGQKVTWNQWESFVDSLNSADATTADKALYKQLYTDNGNKYAGLYPVYSVDYIKLAQKDIAAAAKHYDIAATNTEVFANGDGTAVSGWSYKLGSDTNAAAADSYSYLNNDYVDSVDDTEYYLVSGNSVRTFVGYKNVPAIEDEFIRAIYTVAENTTADLNQNDYWVARVIVIELEGAYSFDSISLAYYNPYQTTSQVHGYDTLNNEAEGVELRIHPQNEAWGAQGGSALGFYGVVGQDVSGDIAIANSLERIGIYGNKDAAGNYTFKYNANHIYAGEIARDKTINNKGGYFDIYTDDLGSAPNRARSTLPVSVPIYGLFQYTSSGRTVVVADGPHNIVENVISAGDRIIYVTDSNGDVAFVVDLDMYTANRTWSKVVDVTNLGTEWDAIIVEQNPAAIDPTDPTDPTDPMDEIDTKKNAFWNRPNVTGMGDLANINKADIDAGKALIAEMEEMLANPSQYGLSAPDIQWLTRELGTAVVWTDSPGTSASTYTGDPGDGLRGFVSYAERYAAANEAYFAALEEFEEYTLGLIETLDTNGVIDLDGVFTDSTTQFPDSYSSTDTMSAFYSLVKGNLLLCAKQDAGAEAQMPTAGTVLVADGLTLYKNQVGDSTRGIAKNYVEVAVAKAAADAAAAPGKAELKLPALTKEADSNNYHVEFMLAAAPNTAYNTDNSLGYTDSSSDLYFYTLDLTTAIGLDAYHNYELVISNPSVSGSNITKSGLTAADLTDCVVALKGGNQVMINVYQIALGESVTPGTTPVYATVVINPTAYSAS